MQVRRRGLARQLDEGRHRATVEGPSGLPHEVLERGLAGERRAVRTIRGQGIVHVGHRDDARTDRDRLAGETVGIAAAVEALMVVADRERTGGEELER